VDYIFEHWRLASFALGQVAASLQPYLLFVVADIPQIFLSIVQIIVEMIVVFALYNVTTPSVTDPFIVLSDYCDANNTAAAAARINLLNNSAAIAIFFGCNSTIVFFFH